MGKSIEKLAVERGHEISAIVDLNNKKKLFELSPNSTDVVIEFSSPSSAFENIAACLRQKVPVISGTTGWLDQLPEIESICNAYKGTFLTSTNFSLGANIFLKLNEWLSQVMKQFPNYKINIAVWINLFYLFLLAGCSCIFWNICSSSLDGIRCSYFRDS